MQTVKGPKALKLHVAHMWFKVYSTSCTVNAGCGHQQPKKDEACKHNGWMDSY